MSFEDNRLYGWLERFANLFYLNLLWLVTSIPVITIFPATAAMFAVARDWVQGKDGPIVTSYFRYMRENFAQSVVVGLLWTGLGLFLGFDFFALSAMSGWIQIPIFCVLLLFTLAYLTTAIYIFPVMVQYRSTWWQVIKNAFLIAGAFPLITLACLGIGLVALIFTFILPVTILFTASSLTYIVYRLCDRAFQHVDARQNPTGATLESE